MLNKIACLLFGHKPVYSDDRDMFGYKYTWQRKYCERCDKTLSKKLLRN